MRGSPLNACRYALQQHDELVFEAVRLLDQFERALHRYVELGGVGLE